MARRAKETTHLYPWFHCSKLSRIPSAWVNFCQWKCCNGNQTGLQAIIAELGWKFRQEQIEIAYEWYIFQAQKRGIKPEAALAY